MTHSFFTLALPRHEPLSVPYLRRHEEPDDLRITRIPVASYTVPTWSIPARRAVHGAQPESLCSCI